MMLDSPTPVDFTAEDAEFPENTLRSPRLYGESRARPVSTILLTTTEFVQFV